METTCLKGTRTALLNVSVALSAVGVACAVSAAEPLNNGHDPEQPTKFSLVDVNGDKAISKDEANKASLFVLVRQWRLADKNSDHVLNESEFDAVTKDTSQVDASTLTFSEVDSNDDKTISRKEAENAGLTQLIEQWDKAEKYGSLNESEFSDFRKPSTSKSELDTPKMPGSERPDTSTDEARKAGSQPKGDDSAPLPPKRFSEVDSDSY
jgi:hypothetical protein